LYSHSLKRGQPQQEDITNVKLNRISSTLTEDKVRYGCAGFNLFTGITQGRGWAQAMRELVPVSIAEPFAAELIRSLSSWCGTDGGRYAQGTDRHIFYVVGR